KMWRLSAFLRRCITSSSSRHCKKDSLFIIHPDVKEALAGHRPVVALESTIITHGMPYPHNLSTVKEVIVRAEGAVPATIGILEGRIHVGLSSDELDFLAQSKTALKVAGIPVFVTGGIGGVHRDGENALDVSADLTELGRTPIAVVSAGVKSILDIGRTLEFLVSGVCVATYGDSKSFPAFFSRQSGFTSPYHVSSPQEAADLVASTLSLGLQSGLLLAVPIPEEHAATGQQIEDAIQTAVTEASSKGVTGRDVTPFILQRVTELTEGKSLQANRALIHNNAKVGSRIACALSKHKKVKATSEVILRPKSQRTREQIVIGGINVDFIAKGTTQKLVFGEINSGSVCQSFGGVGRNIFDNINHFLFFYLYVQVSQFEDQLASASLVVLDGDIPVSTIDYVCCIAKKRAVPVWFEPTDADKACKPFLSESWKALSYTSPNLAELCTMNHTLGLPTPTEVPISLEDVLGCIPALSRPLLEHLHCVVVTLGALGVMVCGEHDADTVHLQPQKQKRKGRLCAIHYPALAVSAKETVNVSGAGDRYVNKNSCVRMGLIAARTSLLSPHPIDPSLTADAIHPEKSHSQLWSKSTCVWMED
uniref:Zgc:136858 n=1 Tax=Sinocyclocheilus anshuiensis TaxID=1608454 RepID=A0A671SUY8_9TELE